jgi:phage terminase large subunit-like protein
MFGNVIRKQGKSGGNVKYAYPAKQTEGNKIDGAVAAIMALSRIMTYEDNGDSYNSRARAGIEEVLRVI